MTCDKHADVKFNGCVYCDRLAQIDYSANLQRFVECLINGREVPQDVLDRCPHHARLLKESKDQALARKNHLRNLLRQIEME